MTIMANAEASQPLTLDEMNTAKQVSAYLKLSLPTLARMRANGSGPKFVRLGASVRYPRESVEQYVKDSYAEAG